MHTHTHKQTKICIQSRMERYFALLVAESSGHEGKGMMRDFNVG